MRCWMRRGMCRQTAGWKALPWKTQVAASKPVTGWNMQPLAGLQESAVHGSLSLQATAGLLQVPVAESQVPGRWQMSCAAQTTGVVMQLPAAHVSMVQGSLSAVHAVPSALGAASQRPAASLQTPSLHWSLNAVQSRATPRQAPEVQTSSTVQKLPSSHAVPFDASGDGQRPVAGSQTLGHCGSDSQITGSLPTHAPA